MAVAYGRVSTDEQDNSQEGQSVAVAAYAAKTGLSLVGPLLFDDGVSARSNPALDQRPGGRLLMECLSTGKARHLIVTKPDRIFRSLSHYADMLRWMIAHDISLHIISQGGLIDLKSPTGKMMQYLLGMFAEFEGDMIALRTKEAMAVKRAAGETCGHVPYGFRRADGVQIVADAAQMAVAESICKMYRIGWTSSEIVSMLDATGVPTPGMGRLRNGKPPSAKWTRMAVLRIIDGQESRAKLCCAIANRTASIPAAALPSGDGLHRGDDGSAM